MVPECLSAALSVLLHSLECGLRGLPRVNTSWILEEQSSYLACVTVPSSSCGLPLLLLLETLEPGPLGTQLQGAAL